MLKSFFDKFGGRLKFVEITIGIIGIFSSFWSYVAQITKTSYILLVVSISLLLLFHYVIEKIKLTYNPKNKLSFKIIYNLLKAGFYISIISIGFSVFMILLDIFYPSKNAHCDTLDLTPIVCITKFSDKKDDEFSYLLTEKVVSLMQNRALYSVTFVDTFLNQKHLINPKLASSVINENCHKKGLVVFGRQSTSDKIFNCTIVVSELLKEEFESNAVGEIIKLKTPEEIDISIDKQSDCIANLIIGVCDFYTHQYKSSITLLEQSLICNENNQAFIKICNTYKAHAFFADGQIEKCLEIYKSEILPHSATEIDFHNLGLIYDSVNDSIQAEYYFHKEREASNDYGNKTSELRYEEKYKAENNQSISLADSERKQTENLLTAKADNAEIRNEIIQSIQIGTLQWAQKNLEVTKFRNGDAIPEAKTAKEWLNYGKLKMPAWCYYNNNPDMNQKYGKLYNWY
ncbi:MAG: FISUMP domain-containing protein, partial [Bacteroidota bacterium]